MRKTIDIVGIASIVSFLLGWFSAVIWIEADDKQPAPRAETQSVAVQTAQDNPGQKSLTAGMRAVGILLDIDVPGYAFPPGSRVDIIWVGKTEGTKELSAKVLLQDALVLEVTCRLPTQEVSLKPEPCEVTVAVTPDQQMVLILGMETGRLTVIRHEDKAAMPAAKTGKD